MSMADEPIRFDLSSGLSMGFGTSVEQKSQEFDVDFVEMSQPLSKGERGGVVNFDTVTPYGDNGISIDSRTQPDTSLIKTSLLFFDKIDIPGNLLYSKGNVTQCISEMKPLGICSRTILMPRGGLIGYKEIAQYPWKAYIALNAREPGRWSIWQAPDHLVIPSHELQPNSAFQIHLNKSFIAPGPTVSYDDVLMFKTRHNDELLAFRHYIEEVAIKLSKGNDPREINLEIEKIEKALGDYSRKAKQSNIEKVIQSFTTEFDFNSAMTSVYQTLLLSGSGIAASKIFELPLTSIAAAIGTGMATGLAIKIAPGLKKAESSPFRYIVRTEQEFGSF
jgi:hypothetical protein